MTDTHIRATHSYKREVSNDPAALLPTLKRLWPYIWPSDRADLKLRVLGAMVLLLVAKLLRTYVLMYGKRPTLGEIVRSLRAG